MLFFFAPGFKAPPGSGALPLGLLRGRGAGARLAQCEALALQILGGDPRRAPAAPLWLWGGCGALVLQILGAILVERPPPPICGCGVVWGAGAPDLESSSAPLVLNRLMRTRGT